MPNHRLIKRTVTEELFEDSSCRLPDIDDDENDAIAADDTDDLVEAQSAGRGKTQDGSGISAVEAAGAEHIDLTGGGLTAMATRRRTRITTCNLDGLSKRDFTAIAAICCETDAPQETSERLAGHFKSQNPRFDRDRFIRATEACKG